MHELLESWGVSSKTEATLGVSQANSLIAFLFTFPLDTEDFGLLGCQSLLQQAPKKKKKKKNPQQSRKEEGRNEVNHSQKANIRQSKLGGIYPAMKGKNTGGEK